MRLKASGFYLFLWITWLITISFLLLMPGENIPNSGIDIPHLDKYLHFIMFAVLSFLFLLQKVKRKQKVTIREKIAVCLVIVCFGLIVEIIQECFILDRHFDWWDVVANTLGTIAGVLLLLLIK
jgi:VanZ family protein